MVRLLPWMGVVLVVGAILTGHEARGQEAAMPDATMPKKVQTPEERIEQALKEPTVLDYAETPLGEVVEDIIKRHHIEVQLDKRALDDLGVGTDTPVTKNLKGVSLRSALKVTLQEIGLTWVIRDEVLLITTLEMAESYLTTVVYDVTDLTAYRDENDEIWYDCDPLVHVIMQAIAPTTWDDVGGPGGMGQLVVGETALLIITQTRPVHEDIVSLLTKLRETMRKHGDKQEPPRRQRPGGLPAQTPAPSATPPNPSPAAAN